MIKLGSNFYCYCFFLQTWLPKEKWTNTGISRYTDMPRHVKVLHNLRGDMHTRMHTCKAKYEHTFFYNPFKVVPPFELITAPYCWLWTESHHPQQQQQQQQQPPMGDKKEKPTLTIAALMFWSSHPLKTLIQKQQWVIPVSKFWGAGIWVILHNLS